MKRKTVKEVDHAACTGCMMCGDVCPQNAITFPLNRDDGFWYPEVDFNRCVECGLCYQKCPSVAPESVVENDPVACYGAKSRNEDIRNDSTSGGFFSEIATAWFDNGGICAGAEYDSDFRIVHVLEQENSGIKALRQSKYAQSYAGGIYKTVKNEIKAGRKVLFCGTPCQVAALNSYLGAGHGNLLTMDFVCCGICSPYVYQKYLEWIEKKYHSKIRRVWFKNKENGWRAISTRIDFENGKKYIRTGSRDPFMTSFVTDALSMRDSCEHCRYRKIPHESDLTVADFWGIENVNPQIDDNKGLSAVIVNSEKGQAIFDLVRENLDYFQTTAESIAAGNFTVYKAKKAHPDRKAFLRDVNLNGFEYAINKYCSYSGINKVRTDINFYKVKLKKRLRGMVK